MTPYRVATLDVFTSQRFTGNQLGLVHVPKNAPLSQETKQSIAKEFGYSETVFLHEDVGAKEGRKLDIFTVDRELPFAGHPTIGTLCYIAQEERRAELESHLTLDISLALKAGPVTAVYDGHHQKASARVPHDVHVHSQRIPATELLASQPGLQAQAAAVKQLREAFDVVSIVKGMTFAMFELPDLECLGKVQAPRDLPKPSLDEPYDIGYVGFKFFAKVGEDSVWPTKYRTRMMGAEGAEDAATGSACCALASYLALRESKGGELYRFEFEQGVEMGRRSVIRVDVKLDESGKAVESVVLAGAAVVVIRGEIEV